MAFTPITGQPVQYSTEDNELASGYYLKFYDSGTTNPYSVATDSAGSSMLAKVKLNDDGYPSSNPLDNSTVFIPHVDQEYRIVLYKNETDADNDTTANSAWNIDGVRSELSVQQGAENVTLKSTTLRTQDDYDRSPLFVDGTDFTAGLGPHVITVPAGWTANAASMRYYRLESDGTITALTPTSSDATTFTLAETLLSTDTIFIGDDKFRNQMDGDPADIRSRLDVNSTSEDAALYYNKTEADARYLLESNNLSDLDSASTARTNLDVYSTTETDNAIGSGVKPRLATRQTVYAGSSTSVDFDSFAGGHPGDGFYVVKYNGSAYSALIYVIQGQAMKSAAQATATTTPRTDVVEINYTSGNVITVTNYSTVTGSTALTINAIEAVG